jgi:glycerophosphoryl diester phosphodiesterase
LTLNIDAVELDIREHSSELWVFHDVELERLTGTAGLFEDHASPSRIRLRNGEAVPTLKQVLDLYWGKMPVNIEIKSINNLQLLLHLLADYPALEPAPGLPWVMISSFDHVAIRQLRHLDCPWSLAPLTIGVPLQTAFELEQIDPFSWHFGDTCLDFDLLRQLREQDVHTLVFTVNDNQRVQRLRQQGVTGIITDFPSKMAQFS